MANDSSDILNKLFIDEAETLKDLEQLVDSASKVFRIERPSGKVIFRDFRRLTDKQRIGALLSGKYFAAKSHVIAEHTLGIAEIAKELGRPVNSLSGPIRQLIKEGFVEGLPDKKYSIVHHRLKDLLGSVLASTK